ncbi:DUF3325 domain-containing protein [Paraglaciecola sp.]|uniref:DUF3325 domain-containing protein n=2 Tax=Paraglaciecola sp. TaxID=1920173 RepID=UPI003262FC77
MLISIFLQALALACLSLAMDKHYKAVVHGALATRRKVALRILGWISLLLSFGLLVAQQPLLGIAVVDWLAWLSCNILLVALLLCWKASRDSVTH